MADEAASPDEADGPRVPRLKAAVETAAEDMRRTREHLRSQMKNGTEAINYSRAERAFVREALAVLLATARTDWSDVVDLSERVKARLDRLDARLDELQAKPFAKFCGVWREGESYAAGNLVTHSGATWHANTATRARPGTSPDWTLTAKSPRERTR